ncbi:hypothetical protein O6H91_13G020000 [Diphasiastrum complanatum]|uniref:Uncharacterized protein n=1 Tax=Diphasiastrum complanatum TaxID=34168 RepID=A0ACC2BSM6_DIPCM|nr:hypothetical protein O6H91_13G020000 [Diphasiastrum complanatum]
MNGSVPQRRAGRGGRHQSLFYRDLSASPTTRSLAVKGESGTPIQGTVAVALWRENVGGADPPPPPFYTLEDRIERSPETPLGESTYRSPDFKYLEGKSPAKTPISSPSSRGGFGVGIVDGVSGYHSQSPVLTSPLQYRTSGSPALWSPSKEYNLFDTRDKRDGESPVSGVVHQQQSGGLLTLPTPREIVRFELQESGGIVASGEEGEEWVTVFGFRVEETNSVVREFEKCGPIVRHVPGPGGANWVHIQFQNHYDARKALLKNGMQLYGSLLIGVKKVDPLVRQGLLDKSQKGSGFMVLPPRTPSKGTTAASTQPSSRPYYLQTNDGAMRSATLIASPAKSTFSRLVDIVFGV